MKKKLTLCICFFALAFGLMACGNSNETETYGGFEASYYEEILTADVGSVIMFDKDVCEQYIETYQNTEGYEKAVELIRDWSGIVDQVGNFENIEDFEVVKSGKTITATLLTKFENREVKFIYVFSSYAVAEGPTSMNVEIVYTMGEIMRKAGLNTIMGILIVFTMLIVMSIIISLFKYIPNIQNAFTKKNVPVPVAEAAPVVEAKNVGTDDLELVAVIAAAIAASTGASTDSFVVRSIRKRY